MIGDNSQNMDVLGVAHRSKVNLVEGQCEELKIRVMKKRPYKIWDVEQKTFNC